MQDFIDDVYNLRETQTPRTRTCSSLRFGIYICFLFFFVFLRSRTETRAKCLGVSVVYYTLFNVAATIKQARAEGEKSGAPPPRRPTKSSCEFSTMHRNRVATGGPINIQPILSRSRPIETALFNALKKSNPEMLRYISETISLVKTKNKKF